MCVCVRVWWSGSLKACAMIISMRCGWNSPAVKCYIRMFGSPSQLYQQHSIVHAIQSSVDGGNGTSTLCRMRPYFLRGWLIRIFPFANDLYVMGSNEWTNERTPFFVARRHSHIFHAMNFGTFGECLSMLLADMNSYRANNYNYMLDTEPPMNAFNRWWNIRYCEHSALFAPFWTRFFPPLLHLVLSFSLSPSLSTLFIVQCTFAKYSANLLPFSEKASVSSPPLFFLLFFCAPWQMWIMSFAP